MGRQGFYKPGSFYRVDDRTGFVVRAERTRKEWNGLIVRDQSWEPRQPQDFVRGVVDNQTVPEPRPLGQPQFVLEYSIVWDTPYITWDNANFVWGP